MASDDDESDKAPLLSNRSRTRPSSSHARLSSNDIHRLPIGLNSSPDDLENTGQSSILSQGDYRRSADDIVFPADTSVELDADILNRTARYSKKYTVTEHPIKASFESLDYELSDNRINTRQEMLKSKKNLYVQIRGAKRWVICGLIGVLTGLTAGLIDFGVERISKLKFDWVKSLIDNCVNSNCMFAPPIVWMLINVGLVLIGAILTAYVEPVAAGSGIPQIKCYLNGVIVPHVVRIKTIITKVIGVVCAVGGGLAVGKEGPMIHSGAVIAAGVSQGRSTSLGFDFRIFREFRSDTEKRDFVAAGAAAGVSAAFGAPVGGVLFSLEEGASFWNQSLVWRILFASMVSSMALNLVQGYIKHHPLDLSYRGLINFGTFDNVSYGYKEILFCILMGAFGGLTGAMFNQINKKLTIFRTKKYKISRWLQVVEVTMVAAYTACFGYTLIFFSNDCKHLLENREAFVVQFFCHDGKYSSSAQLFFDTPENSVKGLFHSTPGSYQILTLTIFAVGYFFLACWTYGLSVPSGLFIPSLLVGAAWGRIFGIILLKLSDGKDDINLSFYALVGASAQLGGIVRMTISLTVIIMEACSSVPLGLPVMISLIIAKWVGDHFNEGLYDIHIHLQGVPLLGWEPLAGKFELYARNIMSYPVTVLRMTEKVSRVMAILKNETHNGYPVVTDYTPALACNSFSDDPESFGTFQGFILRSQLLMMLQKKLFVETPNTKDVISKLTVFECNEMYPRYLPIEKISVTSEEENFTLDLSPFMNLSHYIVHENASYHSIFVKFRSIGLRHMVVINRKNEVVGMITRKDLARYENLIEGGEVSTGLRQYVE